MAKYSMMKKSRHNPALNQDGYYRGVFNVSAFNNFLSFLGGFGCQPAAG
jgi:hypothetical protein